MTANPLTQHLVPAFARELAEHKMLQELCYLLQGVAEAESDLKLSSEVAGALGEALEEDIHAEDARQAVKLLEKMEGKEWKDM